MAITLTEPAANKVRSLIAEQGSPAGTGLRVKVVVVPPNSLPRFDLKAKRVIDRRLRER